MKKLIAVLIFILIGGSTVAQVKISEMYLAKILQDTNNFVFCKEDEIENYLVIKTIEMQLRDTSVFVEAFVESAIYNGQIKPSCEYLCMTDRDGNEFRLTENELKKYKYLKGIAEIILDSTPITTISQTLIPDDE